MGGTEAAASVPVTSVKGTTGHMLGAAGAVEAIVCALSVARDAVPPTAGFAEAAEDCPVAVVTEAMTDYPQKVALSTSLGFGGHNAGPRPSSPYKGLAGESMQRRDSIVASAALGARGHRGRSAPSRSVRVGEPHCGHRARRFHRRRAGRARRSGYLPRAFPRPSGAAGRHHHGGARPMRFHRGAVSRPSCAGASAFSPA